MKFSILAAGLTLAASLMGTTAMASDGQSPWQFRVRAVVVDPVDKATITPIQGTTKHSTQVIPELDISYFFTDNISAELVLGFTKHRGTAVDTALGDVDVGTVWLLPPTLTAQYHFAPDAKFNPYIGAGLNYTIFFGEGGLPNGTPLVGVDHDSSFGPAVQAGVDIKFNEDSDWFFNLDVKKIWMNTKTTVDAGALGIVRADVDLDPWLFGVGVGRRF